MPSAPAGNDIQRIRYFTARLTARPDDPHLYDEDALAAGRRPEMAKVIKTEEKGSDVNLGAYLILDASRADCEVAVAITNDSDLAEPIRLVRDEFGISIGVVNPHRTARRSREIDATFFRQLRSNVVADCQLPEKLIDADGRTIRKPANW